MGSINTANSVVSEEKLRDLHKALMEKDEDEVCKLCREFEDGPLQRVTVQMDTVIHMATFTESGDLVLKLLKMADKASACGNNNKMLLHRQNEVGNTILHEVAATCGDKFWKAALQMLAMEPQLLSMRNLFDENALFRAARFGQVEIFHFLHNEICNFCDDNTAIPQLSKDAFLKKDDGTNLLHISIIHEHFGLALFIAEKYEHLVYEKDSDGMTGLQLLANNPSTFRGRQYKRHSHFLAACKRQEEKQRYEKACKLANFLIKKDMSWNTEQVVVVEDPDQEEDEAPYSAPRQVVEEDQTNTTGGGRGPENGQVQDQNEEKKTTGGGRGSGYGQKKKTKETQAKLTPIFLATISGCVEIVTGILELYPRAVAHIDYKKRTILHLAIEYRQMEIFDMVESMNIPMKRLIRKLDNKFDSVLHKVAKNKNDELAKKIRSPAIQLQEDLLLFERVEKIIPALFTKVSNKQGKTAEMLFAEKNENLRQEAKEWLKRTAEHCSLVAVLIATVAFAAAYTIPGGSDQKTGFPILLNHPFFVIFTITDVLSLTFALTSVIFFLSILTSPFRLKDMKRSLPNKVMLGFTCLLLSVTMMMVAFAATVILMVHRKEQWTKIALYTAAFLPVTVFGSLYLPLYSSVAKTSIHFPKTKYTICSKPLLSWFDKKSFNFLKKSRPSNTPQIEATSLTVTGPPNPQTAPSETDLV